MTAACIVTTTSCSQLWSDAPAAAWGTASPARFWLALEQPGPWGARAITQSRLAPDLGALLDRAVQAAGGRLLLIRAVGQHRDSASPAPRRVLLACGVEGGAAILLEGHVTDVQSLIRLPWGRLAQGDLDAARAACPDLRPATKPALLICTNGKRDVCCAVRGRRLAADAAARRPGTVWECSHTGGHRFAPTGVALPSGATYARLDPGLATAIVDAEARGHLPEAALGARHLRGLAHLDGPSQAADAFVRAQIGETRVAALRVACEAQPEGTPAAASGSGTSTYAVRREDGRVWRVLVTAETEPGPAVSCGGASVPSTSYDVRLA